jgi:hypothetical protein
MTSETTSTPTFVDNGLEELSTQAVRAHLGLRQEYYLDELQHPDQRPCPSWCWVGRTRGEYGHELAWSHPMAARHALGGAVPVVASLYPGEHLRDGAHAASIEVDMHQLGQRAPVIALSRRQYPDGHTMKWEWQLLKLSVEDARELAIALNYVADLAEGKREPVHEPVESA